MLKPRVLLLCGGQSEEHEVSLASARSVLREAEGRLELTPMVIAKSGRLLSAADSKRALGAGSSAGLFSTEMLHRVEAAPYDVVFPLLHGPYGEDGTVQGLLRLMALPFVGSGVLGSALGMDKLAMKGAFGAAGLPQVPYRAVRRRDWQDDPEAVLVALESLGLPVFVKPANLGSSVGIGKVRRVAELREALSDAARFDRRIIVEAGLNAPRELEVGVLGNDDPQASPVGEISYQAEFYDYATKYTEGRAELCIPARIPAAVAERCRSLALAAFAAVDAAGLARVDFFYDEATGALYVNEINTMPGFTTTSMYPKLWEAAGVGYGELVERLVTLALEPR